MFKKVSVTRVAELLGELSIFFKFKFYIYLGIVSYE